MASLYYASSFADMSRSVITNITLLLCILGYMDASEDGILAVECPFLCACAGFTVTCVGTDVFPVGIPNKVRQFHLVNSSFDDIPINAFKDLPDLTEISIYGTTVNTIRACSFAGLENMTSLIFDTVTVAIIEGNAFSNLINISSIDFKDSKIGAFRSYTFHNVKEVEKIVFTSTDIRLIHPFAFLNLHGIDEIMFDSSVIGQFLADGIARIQDFGRFTMKRTRIKEWHCGTLSTLAENNVSVDISETTFNCDCELLWLYDSFFNTSIFLDKKGNKCNQTDKTLAAISMEELCTSALRKTKCHRPLPSTPHSCRKAFDTPFNPEGKVEYPSYFTKAPKSTSSSLQFTISIYVLVTVAIWI